MIDDPHGAPDFFTPGDIDTFFATDWAVHYNSSRTLDGTIRFIPVSIEEAKRLTAVPDLELRFRRQAVKAGQPLLVIESMKMEIVITADTDGEIAQILCAPDNPVRPGQTLLVIAHP